MEEESVMVSRLPKFGGHSSVGGTTPSFSGSTQPITPTQESKSTPPRTRPNGVIRASPFSLKWKKDEGPTPFLSTTPTRPGNEGEDKPQSGLSSSTKEVKSGPSATLKMQRSSSLMLAFSSPKAISKQSLKMSPKVGSKLAQSPLNGDPKMGHNSSNIPGRTGSESRLVRPRLGSSSPRSNSQDSLSQSSDSMKNLSLDNMVRSNSFTHFKQIPSPTSQPMTRSFSFNRAVELAKPLANTQLRPPKSTFLKPPQLSNGRIGLGLGSLNSTIGGGLQCSRTPPASSSVPTLSIPPVPTTPGSLKKHLLPSCVLTKSLGNTGGSLGYRLARSGQAKPQHKPLLTRRSNGERSSADSDCGALLAVDTVLPVEADITDIQNGSDESNGDRGGKDGESSVLLQSSGQAAVETLEEMSLSSASSLDRGDTSEEFLDDFHSAGDVFSDGDLPDSSNTSNTTQIKSPHSIHSGTLDWDNMGLEGHKEESPMEDSQGPLFRSPNLSDVLQASSLELSPSNSSGGTYMWDEDGLEPLVGAGTNHCNSYDDSELNSMDILNNLDFPGTGELNDDDLMLDVDLPEDGIHDSDTMSHIERLERANLQGQRLKYHRWSGPDHLHIDNRAHILQSANSGKASRSSSGSIPSESKQHGYMETLDELTLEHMTQDCSLLKNQLLKLKVLLQLDATDSSPDVPVETEDNSSTSQMEELIKEVQVLRAELRSRDKTIAQLKLQCQQLRQDQQEQMHAQVQQFRCQCHHQRAPLPQSDRYMDRRVQRHYDKATQTYWRSPSQTPQVLHPFNPYLGVHPQRGRPVKTLRTGDHSDFVKSRPEDEDGDRSVKDCMANVSRPVDPNKLSHVMSTHLPYPAGSQVVNARDCPASEAQSAGQNEDRAPATTPQSSVTPRSAASTCPRMLQPLRLHKHVSLPAFKPGGTGGITSLKTGCSFKPLANQTKPMPPPSRGLPSFNAGPQVQPRGLCGTSLLQHHRTSRAHRDAREANSSLE